jgi:serine/threonine-protein kinase
MDPERWKQIEALCHAALKRDEEERAAFLEEACGADEDLRQEVESLLEHQREAEDFIERPAMEVAAKGLAEDRGRELVGGKIGPYKVLSLLGTGGMGEVYLAEDTSLARKVALKFLPLALQQDDVAHERFIREAKSAAAIEHPYICNIKEVAKTDDGQDFIVMEYVEGQTLKDKLERGKISLKEAMQIGCEVAEALEKAHNHGVVHRDFKPSNIMITMEGHAKVMDFGLAKKAVTEEGKEEDLTSALTREGSTLGTPAYMSPEQIRAQPVDHRSDIFSFGIVLYEMLTGVHPFRRTTPGETTGAILHEEPASLASCLDEAPELLQHTVRKMLAKDPERRYQLIHEVRTDLLELEDESPGEMLADLRPLPRRSGPRLWLVLPWVIVVVGLAALILWSPWSETVYVPLTRFSVSLPAEQGIGDVARFPLAMSPDGNFLAYEAGERLYLRRLDQLESTAVPDTEGAEAPFFSPDGQWLGFFTEEALYKARVSGGSPVKICDVEAVANPGGSWGPNDVIAFSPRGPRGLWRVPAGGGTAEKISERGRWPQVLPDGEHILCSVSSEFLTWQPAIWSPTTDEWHTLEVGEAGVRYVTSGHLIYGSSGTLLAVPFDFSRLEVVGSPVPVVDEVRMHVYDLAYFAVSDRGTLAYVPGLFESVVMAVDREGEAVELVREETDLLWLRLSPDGKRLAATVYAEGFGIWIYDLERAGSRIPLHTEGTGYNPVWTPDGKRITFHWFGEGITGGIYWKSADGTGEAELLCEGYRPFSWSSDGQLLAFRRGRRDIWVYHRGGDAEPFLTSRFAENHAAFSPDGQWLAYVSDESGRNEVYVRAYPGPGNKWSASGGGGVGPVWSPDGKELFYRDPSGRKLLAATFRSEPSIQIGTPKILFQGPYRGDDYSGRFYDLAADGETFVLMKQPTEGQSVNVVTNWFEELKRLVPTE